VGVWMLRRRGWGDSRGFCIEKFEKSEWDIGLFNVELTRWQIVGLLCG
jgi:hypothetical protein